ncbi:MAG: hypothetical protein ABSC11_10625 [Smithella sp.]|jgi:tetratricopeptide (TPR) repeat protein
MISKNKKHIIIEVILVLIILIQAVAIYFLYSRLKNDYLKDGLKMMSYLGCPEKYNFITDYLNKGEYKDYIALGEYLAKDGYEDKLLFTGLGSAYFITGNERKAAEYLEESLSAGYACEVAKPHYAETNDLAEAITRYRLSEIYSLLGEKEKADKEYEKAHSIAKRMYSDKYNRDTVDKYFKFSSIVELRKRILNKKEKSS